MWYIFRDQYFPYTSFVVSEVLGDKCCFIENDEIGKSVHASVEIIDNNINCCLIIANTKRTLEKSDVVWLFRHPYISTTSVTDTLLQYQAYEANACMQGFLQNCNSQKINAYSCCDELMNMNLFAFISRFTKNKKYLGAPVVKVSHTSETPTSFAKWPGDNINQNGHFNFSLDKTAENLHVVISLGENMLFYEISNKASHYVTKIDEGLQDEIRALKNEIHKNYLELIIVKNLDKYLIFYVDDGPLHLERLLSSGHKEFERLLYNYLQKHN